MQNIKNNSLKRNFSWNFIGNLIYAATQWGLIVVITRLGSIELVGLFSLGLAITSPIILFTNLQLRTVQATSQNNEFHIGDYFGIRIATDFIFIIILFIYLILSNYDGFTNIIIILVGITKIIESLSDLLYGFFQQKERMELIAKSTIIRGVSSFIVVFFSLYLTGDLSLALICMSLAWLLVFIFYDIKNLYKFSSSLKPRFKISNINIVKLSLPLGLVVMIVSLNTNLPKILIEKLLNVEALGIFASISYLVFVGSKFIDSVGNALLPKLAKMYIAQNVKAFRKYLLILVGLSFMIGLILIIFSIIIGDFILYIIYGSVFSEYKNLLILIMIYGMFNYISYSLMVGLNSMRKFKIQPYLGIFWLIVSISTLSWLIPEYGLVGAAYSLIIYSLSRVVSIGILVFYYLRKI